LRAQEVIAEKGAVLASETTTDDLWNSLQVANSCIKDLENLLAEKDTECQRLQSELDKANQKLDMHQDSSALWKEKHEKTYHELRMQRQTTKQGQKKLTQVQEQVQILKTAEKEASRQLLRGSHESHQAMALLQKQNQALHNELSMSMARWTSQLEKTHVKLATSSSDLKTLCNKASKLHRAVKRGKEQKEQAMASVKKKILDQQSVHHLMQKGVFTEETRNVVHLLVKAGCSRNLISEVISAVLKSAGITAVGSISKTSISQILCEGYFAAQIQLGYEMKNAESMTFSADGTSHHSINYNSHHVHLIAEDYTSPEGSSKQQVT